MGITTEDPDRFKIVRGLNAENHLHHTSYGGVAEVKAVWIDSVVNGFRCVKNEIFQKGVKDCLPPPKEESEVKKIYDGMVETGILPVDITKDGYINGDMPII